MTPKKSLKEKLVATHEAHVAEEMADRAEQHAAITRDSLITILGGIRAVNSVAEALNAQSIRALQRIRDEQLYLSEGFKRFDDFLDESPLSPMNYKKFNRLETALINEGDELFNYLNAINAPLARRRLLGKGTLAVEGEEVVIRDEKEEHRFPVGDRATLLTTLSKLADKCTEQSRTIERQKKKLRKGEEEFEQLKRQAPAHDQIVSRGFGDCLFSAVSALGSLAARCEDLTPEESDAARDRVLELISQPYQKLQESFFAREGKPPSRRHARAGSLTAGVTEADIESLMES
jgi:hypothetical protein